MSTKIITKMKSKIAKKLFAYLNRGKYNSLENSETSVGGEYSGVSNANSNKSGTIETLCTETIFTEEESTPDIKKLPVRLAVSVDYEHEARTSMRQRCRRRGLGKTELKEDLRNLHYTCNILIEINMKDCNLW